MFLQSQPKRGLLTPAEVRVLALAQLDIGPASVIWDVGAGSGSVGIEAAQLAAQGHVYAIEMDPEDHLLIATNAERFGVPNLTPVLGRAPEVWADLPDPDAVFVGGTGRMVVELAEAAFFRLRSRGRMVVNSASIQNVTDVHTRLQQLAGDAHVWMIQIARDVPQLDRLSFQSANPSFLIAAVKGER
jgi:precorrin-6Y C5,15-methyltransferase (decarboxylating)